MQTEVSWNDEPEKWPFVKAMRELRGYSDSEIAELRRSMDHHDFVELVMDLEEEFGIEVKDEEFLTSEPDDPPNDPLKLT